MGQESPAFGGWEREVKPSLHPLFPLPQLFCVSHQAGEQREVAGFLLAVTAGGFCDVDPCPASSGLELLHCFQLMGLPVVGQNEAESRGICEEQ